MNDLANDPTILPAAARNTTGANFLAAAALCLLSACAADGGGGSGPKTVEGVQTVTLLKDQGLVFETGEIIKGIKFNQVDLYATSVGSHLKLATGGDTLTVNSPFNWFQQGGGFPQTFEQLSDVPFEKPTADQTAPLTRTDAKVGFVVECYASAGYARGRIIESDADSLKLEYRWDETNP